MWRQIWLCTCQPIIKTQTKRNISKKSLTQPRWSFLQVRKIHASKPNTYIWHWTVTEEHKFTSRQCLQPREEVQKSYRVWIKSRKTLTYYPMSSSNHQKRRISCETRLMRSSGASCSRWTTRIDVTLIERKWKKCKEKNVKSKKHWDSQIS